jgi:hypothetical protein
MKNKFLLFLLFALPAFTFGQVLKTAAVPYTKGASPFTPNTASSSEIRVDTSCSCMYWWDRDNLTWMRVRTGADVISGSAAPSYTPHDNQSLFAVNADSELYYYNGSAWVQIGGSGGGGIYGGSGNVPDGTIASLVDDFEVSGPDISSYTVTTGTSTGGQYFQNFSGATLTHRDTSGSSSLAMSGTGALFSFGDGSTDRLTIGGRDARYSGDYSGTYSARSLIDKGYADATYLSDADWTTGFSSATQATSSWTATNAATNVNAAIVPKGTGGVLADVPDGSSTGGNSRGIYAVDLQGIRTNASDVASGDYSTIPGGRRCTASGTYSFATGFRGVASGNGSVAFGGSGAFSVGATASGTNSFAMGPGATASGVNSWAYGAGFTATAENSIGFLASSDKYGEFAGGGFSFMRLKKTAIVGAGATELFLDGASLKATIGSGEKWVVEIACLAEVSVVGDGTGGLAVDDTFAATYRCVIANKAGTTALVGTVQADMAAQADATMSDAVFTITADNTGDYLKVTYTGGANTGSSTQTNAYANLRVFKY